MKNRFGGLLLMVLFPCLLIAQNRIGVIDGNSTLKECREYFRRNIDQLDPIEGIYQVESFAQERNNYREFPIQKLDSYTIVVVKIREGVFHVSDYVTISRIGETMYYNYVVDWSDEGGGITTTRFLFDGSTFSVTHELPQEMTNKKLSSAYIKANTKLFFTENGVKEFPVSSMYR